MPASRARTAICSAPLEWPSSPGLPTRNFMRRPSFFDTRPTSPPRRALAPGLCDPEFHGSPELLRPAVDLAAQIVEPDRVVAHAAPDAGRRAVFAKTPAQHRAPLAGGDARLRAGDRGRHDVAARACRAGEIGECRLDGRLVARRAPRLEPRDLLRLDRSEEHTSELQSH